MIFGAWCDSNKSDFVRLRMNDAFSSWPKEGSWDWLEVEALDADNIHLAFVVSEPFTHEIVEIHHRHHPQGYSRFILIKSKISGAVARIETPMLVSVGGGKLRTTSIEWSSIKKCELDAAEMQCEVVLL